MSRLYYQGRPIPTPRDQLLKERKYEYFARLCQGMALINDCPEIRWRALVDGDFEAFEILTNLQPVEPYSKQAAVWSQAEYEEFMSWQVNGRPRK